MKLISIILKFLTITLIIINFNRLLPNNIDSKINDLIDLSITISNLSSMTLAQPKIQQPPRHNVPKPSTTAKPAPQRQFNYGEASVLLVTSWPAKPGIKYVLLGREAFGADKGKWDNFGGDKDPEDNNNPLLTALRELQEESINLIDSDNYVRGILEKSEPLNNKYKSDSVSYVAEFPHDKLENLTRNFYKARKAATAHKYKEKDLLAWVKYDKLKDIINNAKRDHNGRLITPIKIKGNIVNPQNPTLTGQINEQTIKLRPFFVSKLQGLLQ